MARKKKSKAPVKTTKPAPKAEAPKAEVIEVPEVQPIILGKTSRTVLECVIAATLEDEVVVARTVSERTGVKVGQSRTILRTLRDKGLVELNPPMSPEDRLFRYNAAADAADRLAAGDIIKAERASKKKVKVLVDPMAPELYTPLALKLAAIDRAITRWIGTAYRERKAIREAGNDPEDTSQWLVRKLMIDGETVELNAIEVGHALRDVRNSILDNPAFIAAQRAADRELLSIVKDEAEEPTTIPSGSHPSAPEATEDLDSESEAA